MKVSPLLAALAIVGCNDDLDDADAAYVVSEVESVDPPPPMPVGERVEIEQAEGLEPEVEAEVVELDALAYVPPRPAAREERGAGMDEPQSAQPEATPEMEPQRTAQAEPPSAEERTAESPDEESAMIQRASYEEERAQPQGQRDDELIEGELFGENEQQRDQEGELIDGELFGENEQQRDQKGELIEGELFGENEQRGQDDDLIDGELFDGARDQAASAERQEVPRDLQAISGGTQQASAQEPDFLDFGAAPALFDFDDPRPFFQPLFGDDEDDALFGSDDTDDELF